MKKKPSSSSSYAAPYQNNVASYSRDIATSAVANRPRSALSEVELAGRTPMSKTLLGGVA